MASCDWLSVREKYFRTNTAGKSLWWMQAFEITEFVLFVYLLNCYKILFSFCLSELKMSLRADVTK